MKTIVNNLAVAYAEEGSGPVMLLLHGWKTDLSSFNAIATLLAPDFKVIRLDLPGFGGSELPKEPWEVGEYARFVKEFCEKRGFYPEVVVGHSFGGRVTLKGFAEGFFRPKKLVLIASAGLAKHKTLRNRLIYLLAKVGKLLLAIFPSAARERVRAALYRRVGSDYQDAGPLKKTFLLATHEDLSEAARSITVPTLLIWGENDSATPLSDGRRLAELISGSKLKVFADAGHFVHQEKPTEVAKLIREFIL